MPRRRFKDDSFDTSKQKSVLAVIDMFSALQIQPHANSVACNEEIIVVVGVIE